MTDDNQGVRSTKDFLEVDNILFLVNVRFEKWSIFVKIERERKKREKEREKKRKKGKKGNRKLTNVASFGHLKIKEKKGFVLK